MKRQADTIEAIVMELMLELLLFWLELLRITTLLFKTKELILQ